MRFTVGGVAQRLTAEAFTSALSSRTFWRASSVVTVCPGALADRTFRADTTERAKSPAPVPEPAKFLRCPIAIQPATRLRSRLSATSTD